MRHKTGFEAEIQQYYFERRLKNKKPTPKFPKAKTPTSVKGRGVNKNIPNCKQCKHRIYQPDNVWNPDGCLLDKCNFEQGGTNEKEAL